MPTSKTPKNTPAPRSGHSRASVAVARRRAASKPLYVMRNNRPTHVLVPIDEYQELVNGAEVQQVVARLEDPTTQWVPARTAAVEFAGSWIAAARQRAGLTQKQLAERVGVPQSQISRIEKHPDHTTLRTMKRIAAALGLDVAALLSFATRR